MAKSSTHYQTNLHRYIDLPRQKDIDQMYQLQTKYQQALEIDNDKQLVRCQVEGCGEWKPITKEDGSNLTPKHSGRIYHLTMRIRYVKQYGIGRSHSADCTEEEQELHY